MSPPTLYFGYGSNLWLEQMRLRCPSSVFAGVGRLKDFRWMISSRGYANIVPHSGPCVYGLTYELTPTDEAALDRNEGVPYAYTKENMTIEFWNATQCIEGKPKKVDIESPEETKSVLVYIDRLRIDDDEPKEEYVHRMNMGITDAVAVGVPVNYIEDDIRPFIPISVNAHAEGLALEQAKNFIDNR